MEDLDGRTAFVTGGPSGIALGSARACAATGMPVAIVDVDELGARSPAPNSRTAVSA